jgi:hypothetical protein
MPNPARNLSNVLKGSGFINYLNGCRKDDMEAYDALHEAAQTVYQGIVRAGGGAGWAMGLDVRIIARRIRRAIQHAADLHLEAARAHGTAAGIYNATLGAPAADRADATKTFDPTS